ncbi:hypothetical protein BC739_009301 [Kutzneria viridogrisea]|uniref:Uncharacterized protein n=2 Tax=Kutzneria TaxID=43356 RepID=W5W748_9PSEU|nr:hypothetical protein [Kutzneria albida]AHH96993.1 hypothetical protein KALB_3629 [Kutzneria albida DSM 43870]MBA8932042.1 hypothetical protein [Kutzneria viridogrisea]
MREGGYPCGWLVRYRHRWHSTPRGPAAAKRVLSEATGTVSGHCLHDLHTGTTWVPVRQHEDDLGASRTVIRAEDILHACPPCEQ